MTSSISSVTLPTTSSMRGGMNPAIQDQPLHGLARDFAPDGIKARKNHRPRRVVYQHRHPGGRLKGADVPAFASDDAALDFIAA